MRGPRRWLLLTRLRNWGPWNIPKSLDGFSGKSIDVRWPGQDTHHESDYDGELLVAMLSVVHQLFVFSDTALSPPTIVSFTQPPLSPKTSLLPPTLHSSTHCKFRISSDASDRAEKIQSGLSSGVHDYPGYFVSAAWACPGGACTEVQNNFPCRMVGSALNTILTPAPFSRESARREFTGFTHQRLWPSVNT